MKLFYWFGALVVFLLIMGILTVSITDTNDPRYHTVECLTHTDGGTVELPPEAPGL